MGSTDATTLGVDYGTVRIGLALALAGSSLVIPLETLPHPGEEPIAALRLAKLVKERGVDEVVIGDPLNMDGTQSAMSLKVRAFGQLLMAEVSVPVHFQDERLTSQDAERQFREAGLGWRDVDKGHIDAVAAMGILKDWLQAQGRLDNARGEAPEALPEPPDPPQRRSRRDRRRDSRRRR